MMETWRAVVNGILYETMYDTALDDAAADRVVRALIDDPLGNLTAEDELSALQEAVRVGTGFDEAVPISHGDDTVRTFLGRVLTRMEQLRPWPGPILRRMPPLEWRGFPRVPAARISESYAQAGRLIGEIFQPSGEPGDQKVLVLGLRSGAELAFVGPWWPGSKDVAVLLRGSRQSTREVVAELLNVTEMEPEDITVLVE